MKYNWCWYYRKAYEKKKRENIILAGKVADAEGKREELQAKYAAICANPLYKMTRPFYLVKRGCGKIVRKAEQVLQGGSGNFLKKVGNIRIGGDAFLEKAGSVCFREEGSMEEATPEKLSASYGERLAFQRDSYSQWIREEEPALWKKCEEALQNEKSGTGERRYKHCCVVSYRELANITDLAQVLSKGKGKSGSWEENFSKKEPGKQEMKADILLLAENPEDLDEKAVSYIENWFTVHPETKLFYGAEDHRFTVEKEDRREQASETENGKVNVCGPTDTGKRSFPWFKPCFSTDTLLGFFLFWKLFRGGCSMGRKGKIVGVCGCKTEFI